MFVCLAFICVMSQRWTLLHLAKELRTSVSLHDWPAERQPVSGWVLTGGAACSRAADHQRMSSYRQIMETLAASSLVYCPLSTGPGYWYLLS